MMAYYSFINMGVSYFQENNYFNALSVFETAISKEGSLIKGLNNIATTLNGLGLQKGALHKYNRAISYLEKGRKEGWMEPFIIYSNRANIFRLQNSPDLMIKDIEKALFYKKNYGYAWQVKGKYEIQMCKIQSGIDCFTKAIEFERTKAAPLINRAQLFELLGDYHGALDDLIKASKFLKNPKVTLYRIGSIYYKIGDVDKANQYYEKFLLTGELALKYPFNDYIYGVVQNIDLNKGYGFILGRSWFNKHDSLYFKTSDCNIIPKTGERVRFKLNYAINKGKFKANAQSIEPYYHIDYPSFKKEKIYHGLISVRENAFKVRGDFEYFFIFYPYSDIFPLSLIEGELDLNTNQILNRDGYVFVEFKLTLDEIGLPNISLVKKIEYPNIYSTKVKGRGSKFNIRKPNSGFVSNRVCSVCGMNEWCGTDGCPFEPD